jgi:hypothetical protein
MLTRGWDRFVCRAGRGQTGCQFSAASELQSALRRLAILPAANLALDFGLAAPAGWKVYPRLIDAVHRRTRRCVRKRRAQRLEHPRTRREIAFPADGLPDDELRNSDQSATEPNTGHRALDDYNSDGLRARATRVPFGSKILRFISYFPSTPIDNILFENNLSAERSIASR